MVDDPLFYYLITGIAAAVVSILVILQFRNEARTTVDSKTSGSIGILPPIISVGGMTLLVAGIIISNWSDVVWGAFLFVGCFPEALLKRFTSNVLRWLCLFVVGVLGYFYASSRVFGVFMAMMGAAGLASAIYLMSKRHLEFRQNEGGSVSGRITDIREKRVLKTTDGLIFSEEVLSIYRSDPSRKLLSILHENQSGTVQRLLQHLFSSSLK